MTYPDEPSGYWQQHVAYDMEIDVDVERFRYTGKQKLVYTNNSPDTLRVIYYHLYYNAFQPGSAMDKRLSAIPDPDRRMVNDLGEGKEPRFQSRIALLGKNETGYIRPGTVKQDGVSITYEVNETIMRLDLVKPLPPRSSTTLTMEYSAQIPVMIRRSGRQSPGGIALSMTQWYPKVAVYDADGWHTDPYIAREFYGEWGDYDVRIHIDRNYTLGGTGYLQNPQEVGHGYEDPDKELTIPDTPKLTWHFTAPAVHDFAWIADDRVIHDIRKMDDGTELHFIYKDEPGNIEKWKALQPITEQAMNFYNNLVGKYNYRQFSVLQGGDGGMEYPMCTLITGKTSFNGLQGTLLHELAHQWFYFMLANNETAYPWMDEGFASYIDYLAGNAILHNRPEFIFQSAYEYNRYLATSPYFEPLSTHSDRYKTNMAYGINAYDRGLVLLSQLSYITGEEVLHRILKNYFETFKGKHPQPRDFIRIAEKTSGMQLKWYFNEFIESVHYVDYAIDKVETDKIILKNLGDTPMPIELDITYADGSTEALYIPLDLTGTNKKTKRKILNVWNFGKTTYTVNLKKKVQKAVLDGSLLMADINREDNVYSAE